MISLDYYSQNHILHTGGESPPTNRLAGIPKCLGGSYDAFIGIMGIDKIAHTMQLTATSYNTIPYNTIPYPTI